MDDHDRGLPSARWWKASEVRRLSLRARALRRSGRELKSPLPHRLQNSSNAGGVSGLRKTQRTSFVNRHFFAAFTGESGISGMVSYPITPGSTAMTSCFSQPTKPHLDRSRHRRPK